MYAGVLALSATQNPSLPRSFITRGRTSQALPLLLLSCYQVWRHMTRYVSWTYQCPEKHHTGQMLHLGLAGACAQTAVMLFVILKAHGNVPGSL